MKPQNPYPPEDADRHELWELLVARDIEAFASGEWQRVADDFIAEGFMGVDANGSRHHDDWALRFPTLASYRERWQERSRTFRDDADADAIRAALYSASALRRIDVVGDAAVVHKQLRGAVPARDGKTNAVDWTTLYFCRRAQGRWRIQGFVGYLPTDSSPTEGKRVPAGAAQHVTAGPYSPVLEVSPDRGLVVISGQAAIDPAGRVVGDTIEEQATLTLENCRRQLDAAGCTLADVFKANVFLADVADWGRFNSVYERLVPAPRPVRTTVGARLLPGLLIEIEMWAVKS